MKTKSLKKVSLGNLDGYGTTKAEAEKNLDAQIQWCAKYCGTSSVECRFGLVGILTSQPEGWCYQIVDQTEIDKARGAVYSSCIFGRMEYTDALKVMRNAMCQRAWSPDVTDDSEFIARANCGPSESRELATLFAHYRATAKQESV